MSVMNRPSYASNFAIGAALIVFLQPWLLIGGMLYHHWGHYGASLLTFIFLAVWVVVFLGSLWIVFVKFRQALTLAGGVVRKISIIVAVLAGIMMTGVVCYPLVVNPVGARWVPVKKPTEDRRVVHPLGFSIVSPPGWKARMWNFDKIEACIALGPGYKGRHGPGLAVSTLVSPPDLSQFRETAFLDLKAYEHTVTGRGENARLRYELVVIHKDQWYRVVYSESRAFETDPSLEFPGIIRHYIRSFRPAP